MTSHNHVDELVAGYLLGAIEPGETERVRTHVDECGDCLRLLAETRELLASLPGEVAELSPRNALKTKIMQAARADLESGGIADERRPGEARGAGATAARPGFAGTMARWAPFGAVAAVVVAAFAGLLGWTIVLSDRVDERDQRLAQLEALIDAVPRSQTVVTMEGTDAAPELHAALVVSDGGVMHVIATGVPVPESGDGYHLWLYDGGQPLHAAVLEPDERGVITAVIETEIDRFERIAVDLQPVDAKTPGGVTVLAGGLN